MIQAHMKENATIPWWAAFGAPLVIVPLLVALLALGSPRRMDEARVPDAPDATRIDSAQGTLTPAPGARIELPPPDEVAMRRKAAPCRPEERG